jgi:hypothetical protein
MSDQTKSPLVLKFSQKNQQLDSIRVAINRLAVVVMIGCSCVVISIISIKATMREMLLTEKTEKPSEKTDDGSEYPPATSCSPKNFYLVCMLPQLFVSVSDSVDCPRLVSDGIFDFRKPLWVTDFVNKIVSLKVGLMTSPLPFSVFSI